MAEETEDYQIILTMPLPVRMRTEEGRSPSIDLMSKLADVLLRDGFLQAATVQPMPTNPDINVMPMLNDSLLVLKHIVTNMHDGVMDDGKMSLFYSDLCAMRDAIISMGKTVKAMQDKDDLTGLDEAGLAKAAKDGRVRVVTPDTIDDVPIELLHAMAHKVADELKIEFECLEHGMDKNKIIEWMKKHAFGIEGRAN